MDPKKIHESMFYEENWYDYTSGGGCTPYALAGVLAFANPEMSVEKTVSVVRELIAPVRSNEQMYRYHNTQVDFGRGSVYPYRKHYDTSSGNSFWSGWLLSRVDKELVQDLNNRLKLSKVGLRMGFYKIEEAGRAFKALSSGKILLPSITRRNHTFEKTSQAHHIALALVGGQYISVDGSLGATVLNERTVENIFLRPEFTQDYDNLNTVFALHEIAPLIYFEQY